MRFRKSKSDSVKYVGEMNYTKGLEEDNRSV